MDNKVGLPSVGTHFRQTWALVKEKLGTLMGIAGLLFAAAFAFQYFFGSKVDSEGSLELGVSIVGFGILFVAFELVTQIAMINAVSKPVAIDQAYSQSWRKVLPYLWTNLIMGVIIVIGFILLIVPGIIFMIWYSMSNYIVVLEDMSGWSALKKSKEYVKGYGVDIFVRFVLIGLSVIIISIPGQLLFGDSRLGSALYSGVLALIYTPFVTAYAYLLYKYLKEIKSNAFQVVSTPTSTPPVQ